MKKSLARIILFASAVAFISMNGCRLDGEVDKVTNGAVLNIESTTMTCSDGIDNDGDTLKDCNDPDCLALGTLDALGPGKTVCPNEKAMEVNQGEFSCDNNAKPVFVSNTDARCLTESSEYVCADGKDNDGNSYTDCNDNSCKGLRVCCTVTAMEGKPDCEAGMPGCTEEQIAKSITRATETCMDGLDNDCNGYIDCADYNCTRNDGVRYFATAEAIEYCQSKKCPDGINPENTLEACMDGLDNDCNGYIDCADYSCSRAEDLRIVNYCNADHSPKPEDSSEACSDKKDNDLDGLIDCDDQDCKSFSVCDDLTPEPAVRPFGFSTKEADYNNNEDIERVKAILKKEKDVCTDELDNNKNGLTDCEEYRCKLRSFERLTGPFAEFNFSCNDEHE